MSESTELLAGLTRLTVMIIASSDVEVAAYEDKQTGKFAGCIEIPNDRPLATTPATFDTPSAATTHMQAVVEACIRYENQ